MCAIRKIYWFLSSQLGLDFRKLFKSIIGIPRYINDVVSFRRNFDGKFNFSPCLFDWSEEGGYVRNEYFWQDLFVSQKIYSAGPEKHVDVGSRIDGFVAHVASFRLIEVFDIRPVTVDIPNVIFKQADFMELPEHLVGYCDSLSCLHALEHFGLGRYGDRIEPQGHKLGLGNLANILKPGGVLYLSVPIGVERVEFNANRVFNSAEIVSLASEYQLELKEFASSKSSGPIVTSTDLKQDISSFEDDYYALGIFTFVKTL